MFRMFIALMVAVGLGACTEVATTPVAGPSPTPAAQVPDELRGSAASRAFGAVVARVEPVAERECRRRTSGVNCDFRIVVDTRPGIPPNAFQTLDDNRRPVIVFTAALLEEARNVDEIAFVMGHETAHHIEGHIDRQQQNALQGAGVLATIATLAGASPAEVRKAAETGAAVGARSFSKEFELEADALGTVIAARSGYSPLKGAQFFNRIPDPGNRFLGTHPPNAARLDIVKKTVAELNRQGQPTG